MHTGQFETHISCKSTQIKYPTKNAFPRSRGKHASCVHENYVYMFAGKDGNTPLKDFWRFHSGTLKWEKLSFRGDTPSYLEGHTLVSYKKLLLLFGGEFGENLSGSSLWSINPDLNYIRNVIPDPGTERPCVRRHHSAVVYSGAMYVYGGYVDVKGSSSELWCYQIDDEEWELLSPRQPSNHTPGCRYGHSTVTHDGHMWLYGGMADLVPKQDLWAYSFGSGRWERIKNKYGPPQLTNHTATVVGSYMILFGGTANREAVNQLWCFCFKTLKWTQIFLDVQCPSARTFHSAVVISPSSQDISVKASSMPYLQKKISQLNIDRPRPKSSPGQRSQSKEALNESVSRKHVPYERSVSSHVYGVKGCDPNDPIAPKWDSLSKTSQQGQGHYYSESSESLKLYPSSAENTVDKSHLLPKKTDYNYNTAELLNRNVVRGGIDNPGISNSTEELINEARRTKCGHNDSSCDRSTTSQECVTCVESINSHYCTTDLQAADGQRVSAKRSRLDPELVLEDLEFSDCFPHNVKLQYPRSNSLVIHRSLSNECILEESSDMETIELGDMPAVRYRAYSENSFEMSSKDPHDNMTESYIGSGDHTINSGHNNHIAQTFCVTNQRESNSYTHQKSEANVPDSVEMEVISSPPVQEMNRRNRLYTKNTQLRRKSVSMEPPYMLVLGGKDKASSNIGLKPVPMWKFTINAR